MGRTKIDSPFKNVSAKKKCELALIYYGIICKNNVEPDIEDESLKGVLSIIIVSYIEEKIPKSVFKDYLDTIQYYHNLYIADHMTGEYK